MAEVTTRQRVLDKSAELFNGYGIDSVSIGQISKALAISTGNLTYYFKKKEDLIRAHIVEFEQVIRGKVDSFPLASNPRTFAEAYVDLLRMSLRYRFLFVGGSYILRSDPAGAKLYKSAITSVRNTYIRQAKNLVKGGYLQPIQKPYNIEMLIDSMGWQWLGWLLLTQVEPLLTNKDELRQVVDAVLHILFLSHHYMDPKFFKAVQSELGMILR